MMPLCGIYDDLYKLLHCIEYFMQEMYVSLKFIFLKNQVGFC